MSEIQKAAVMQFTSGRVFAAINSIFADLPDRFTMNQLMAKSHLKGHGSMLSAISVLERSFKCNRTAAGIWRKPGAKS